ncbi:ATP-binding protein [Streptomyces indiaensis]|uniref:ATP-binding protein n=1 Tax=Streptomyces indiaensis TaxID=284033 RepID=UPI001F42E944|nr:ATP-binding protein [Streptomyces indiaensis]MCF1648441.1 ATP-binding protein [Streptomyces indiaensis]
MTAPASPRRSVTERVFAQRLSATPRGARLARHLAVGRLCAWGIPYGTDVSEAVALVVAELAANAVTHGRVPGRDFEVRLSLVGGSVRIEVTDAHSGPPSVPGPGGVEQSDPLDEHGRGLVLVAALADRWQVVQRKPSPGKTVRAEIDMPGWLFPHRADSSPAR